MSLTYKSAIIWLIYQLLKIAGIELPGEGAIETAIDIAVNIGLALVTLYGRWRVGDLKILGGRKI